MALDFNEYYDIEEHVHQIKEFVPFEKIFKNFDKKACMNGRSFVLDYSVFSEESRDFLNYHFYDEHQESEEIHKKYSKCSSTLITIDLKEKYHRSEIEKIEKVFKNRLVQRLAFGGNKINSHYPFVCNIIPAVINKGTINRNVDTIMIYFDHWIPNNDLFNTLESSREFRSDYDNAALPW